jgi:hypothetical protein
MKLMAMKIRESAEKLEKNGPLLFFANFLACPYSAKHNLPATGTFAEKWPPADRPTERHSRPIFVSSQRPPRGILGPYRPFSMLDTNRLQPPRRCQTPSPASQGPASAGRTRRDDRFISADDFDATGILAGMDLCASSYWWVPELHAPPVPAAGPATVTSAAHATARMSPRSTAAA